MLRQSRSWDPDTWDEDIWENAPEKFWLYRFPQALRVCRCCPLLPPKHYLFFLLEDTAETSPLQDNKCPCQEFPTHLVMKLVT